MCTIVRITLTLMSINMKNRRKTDSVSILKRHYYRVTLKRRNLEIQHEKILSQVNKLYSKLELIKKTYGFVKCLFNDYLKSQIKRIKSMIKSLKKNGQNIVDSINNFQHKESLPFV